MTGSAMTFLVLSLTSAFCLGGCGGQQVGMVENAKESSKTPDAQDSMKAYMKSMQNKGMKPGMKASTKS